MSIDDRIDTFVLREFRLRAADGAIEAARIVAAFSDGIQPAVPLLTSIDDGRDVAVVRALHAGEMADADPLERAALEPLVASWQPARRYGPRISERSENPPTYYRLAVTESGINTPDSRHAAGPAPDPKETRSSTRLDLLWIGVPIGTPAGLLTVIGSDGDELATRPDPGAWPLPFSRVLGVRIYESRD
jgi:hypothetical protein